MCGFWRNAPRLDVLPDTTLRVTDASDKDTADHHLLWHRPRKATVCGVNVLAAGGRALLS